MKILVLPNISLQDIEKMRLTNNAFADQGLTGSILGRKIGQMDCGEGEGGKYIDIAAIWVRSHLTDVTELSQRRVVGWGM